MVWVGVYASYQNCQHPTTLQIIHRSMSKKTTGGCTQVVFERRYNQRDLFMNINRHAPASVKQAGSGIVDIMNARICPFPLYP